MPAPRTRFNLLDTLIVFFAGSALFLFLLWITTRISGVGSFDTIPDYIQGAASQIFAALTGTTVLSVILYYVRRHMDGKVETPRYFLSIALVVIIEFAVILALSIALPWMKEQSTKRATNVIEVESGAESLRFGAIGTAVMRGRFVTSNRVSTLQLEKSRTMMKGCDG